MKTNSILFAGLTFVALAFSSSAFSAAYIKFDGVDGEAKNTMPQNTQIQSTQPTSVGLLLPAVQSAREAARRSSSSAPTKGQKKGYTEYTWKVEEGEK